MAITVGWHGATLLKPGAYSFTNVESESMTFLVHIHAVWISGFKVRAK